MSNLKKITIPSSSGKRGEAPTLADPRIYDRNCPALALS